jgi:hypothetical protein
MKQKTLSIRTQDGRRIAKLIWRDGTVLVECDTRRFGLDVDRWVREGVNEWVGSRDGEVYGDKPIRQNTPAHKEEFLARLAGYVQRHFGFATTLSEESALVDE